MSALWSSGGGRWGGLSGALGGRSGEADSALPLFPGHSPSPLLRHKCVCVRAITVTCDPRVGFPVPQELSSSRFLSHKNAPRGSFYYLHFVNKEISFHEKETISLTPHRKQERLMPRLRNAAPQLQSHSPRRHSKEGGRGTGTPPSSVAHPSPPPSRR